MSYIYTSVRFHIFQLAIKQALAVISLTEVARHEKNWSRSFKNCDCKLPRGARQLARRQRTRREA